MTPWIVTREERDAHELVSRLRARGMEALSIPAITRATLPWPAVLDKRVHAGTLFFLTSPYAARTVLDALGERLVSLEIAATEPATAELLRRNGVRTSISARGGAVKLARAVVDAGFAGTALYPTSDAGLLEPEQAEALALLGSCGPVLRAPVYSTTSSPHLVTGLRALNAWRAIVFSPSAARALTEALADSSVVRPALVVTVGASTMRALAHARNHMRIASVEAPRDDDLVDFLSSLSEKT